MERHTHSLTDAHTAFLSNRGEYSFFTFRDRTISFLTGKNLERYVSIKEWSNGYLVVMCLRRSNPEQPEEDYIDLRPILKNLYISPTHFLKPIHEVKVKYA